MEPIDELRAELSEALVVAPDVVDAFMLDESRAKPDGRPLGVVRARDTADVVTTLRWASRHRVPVTARGSGTGLSGGAVAIAGGLVLSLADMTSVVSVDPVNRLARVEAGVITATIDAAAEPFGLMYAPDPGSYRESTIGGNIATNAGGLRCVKFGVTRDSVVALDVVLADGSVVHTGGNTRKDVAGFDLNDLFIGSEGTLGVVVAATVRLLPRPSGPAVTFRAVFEGIALAGTAVEAIMTSPLVPDVLELMDAASVKATEEFLSNGVDLRTSGVVLVGQFVSETAERDAEAAAQLCRDAGSDDISVSQSDELLEARRVTGRALSAAGLRVSSDVAVPLSALTDMFRAIEAISASEGVAIPTFAHAGDGNLHPSIIVTSDDPAEHENAERILHDIMGVALRLGGTISGEHGIGSLKRDALSMQFDEPTLAAHRLVKTAFDPLGILNPGRGI